ncbi:hypothetical protein CFC21_072048 [Triticum aestivum]|uniref:Uncharacterized protein n=2 Tax=Triticum aestivum TaxID=4565 RepID=A0A3B6LNQ3_WHEAT|nr:uncharacterized protein LOC123116330 [Triticum aestivum]KAF7065988.1 hypothetical protein CFC21_072048 [Triticum aestivum]
MSPSSPTLDAPGTTASSSSSSSSCFALAWHMWSLCALHVALVLSSVAAAALIVVLLPFACTAASLCLVCAIAARLLSCSASFATLDRTAAQSDGADGDAYPYEEEEDGGGAELETRGRECTAAYIDGAHESIDPYGDEQDRRFVLAETGNYYYCRKFYDLLAFWRRKERDWRRG